MFNVTYYKHASILCFRECNQVQRSVRQVDSNPLISHKGSHRVEVRGLCGYHVERLRQFDMNVCVIMDYNIVPIKGYNEGHLLLA